MAITDGGARWSPRFPFFGHAVQLDHLEIQDQRPLRRGEGFWVSSECCILRATTDTGDIEIAVMPETARHLTDKFTQA